VARAVLSVTTTPFLSRTGAVFHTI
jgi:hypothetical protein